MAWITPTSLRTLNGAIDDFEILPFDSQPARNRTVNTTYFTPPTRSSS